MTFARLFFRLHMSAKPAKSMYLCSHCRYDLVGFRHDLLGVKNNKHLKKNMLS